MKQAIKTVRTTRTQDTVVINTDRLEALVRVHLGIPIGATVKLYAHNSGSYCGEETEFGMDAEGLRVEWERTETEELL